MDHSEGGLHQGLALRQGKLKLVGDYRFAHFRDASVRAVRAENGRIVGTLPNEESAVIIVGDGRIFAVGIVIYTVRAILHTVIVGRDVLPFCVDLEFTLRICGDYGYGICQLLV